MPLSVIYSCESTLQCSQYSSATRLAALQRALLFDALTWTSTAYNCVFFSCMRWEHWVSSDILRKPHVLCLYQKTIILDRLMAKQQGSIFLELCMKLEENLVFARDFNFFLALKGHPVEFKILALPPPARDNGIPLYGQRSLWWSLAFFMPR